MAGNVHRRIHRPEADVMALAFLNGGKSLVTGHAGDGNVLIWDLETNGEPDAVMQDAPPILCLAASPDGQWLMSGGYSNLRAFNLQHWREAPPEKYAAPIHSIAFHHEGRLAAVYISGYVCIIDAHSRQPLCPLIPTTAKDGTQVAFRPNSSDILLTEFYYTSRTANGGGGGAKLVHRWSMDRNCLATRYRSPNGMRRFSISSCGRLLAATCNDGQTRVWDIEKGTVLQSIPISGRPLAFHPLRNILAIGHSVITLWDVNAERAAMELDGAPRWNSKDDLIFSPDGAFLAATGEVATVWALDLPSDSDASACRSTQDNPESALASTKQPRPDLAG